MRLLFSKEMALEIFRIRRYFWRYWVATLVLMGACSGIPVVPQPPVLETATESAIMPTATNIPVCKSIPIAPTSGPEEVSIFPVVSGSEHVKGSMDAAVTIIEYGDFQCPGCASLAPVLAKLEETFSSELRVVFRQLPLYDIHDKTLLAAQAAEAASDEGKFWEMHDLLYGKYEQWVSMNQDDFNRWLLEQAENIGLGAAEFKKKINSQEIIDRVENDLEQALSIGLRTTPFLLINGQIYNGPRDYNSLEKILRLIALGKRQFTTCPEMSIDPLKQYIATLHTEKGDITIQLYADNAPLTVNSFIFLAHNGWYDNIPFHLVIPGYVAQTGDPSGTGLGGPGYLYDNESNGNLSFDRPGVVAMANSGMNTNGGQFFITYTPQSDFNGRFTIFGQVIDGMDVLAQLTPRNSEVDNNPPAGDLLISVEVVEK